MADPKRFSMGEEGTLLDKAIAESANHYFDELDYRNHRQVYVGVHLPLQNASSSSGRPSKRTNRGSARRHHHGHRHRRKHKEDKEAANDSDNTSSLPNERVRFILGGQEVEVEGHQIFAELDEYRVMEDGAGVWKESARWLKFEEDVEEVGDRWSKPHVATLSLYSLFELRSCLLHGSVLLDLNASNLEQICDLVLDDLVYTQQLEQDNRAKVKEVLLQKHVHQFDKSKTRKPKNSQSIGQHLANLGSRKASAPTLATMEKKKPVIEGSKSVPFNLTALMEEDETNDSEKAFPYIPSAVSLVGQESEDKDDTLNNDSVYETFDHNFMKKIPIGAEASNALVGEVDFLKKPIIAFVRLENGLVLRELTEVPLPTRFLFIMLGPPSTPGRYHEVGRAIATLMSDEIFHEVAYKANCRQDLLSGIDEFLMQVTVLPPGEWDPSIRIEPPATVPSQEKRLEWGNKCEDEDHDPADREEHLKKTGRPFGGLLADLRRRLPWYCSDFKDALSPQCIASVIFIYFACLTPIITFGGLMSTKTDHYMGAVEQMLACAIGGILFSLFGGQPLIILGATGPMLVFEEIIYSFCKMSDLEYLPFRMWIGIWTMLFCFVLVITDASSYVCYFTRFTEECFATLIALIFIVEGFSKLWHVKELHPIDTGYTRHHSCLCMHETKHFGPVLLPNGSVVNKTITNLTELNVPMKECHYSGGKLTGIACDENVFFLSTILTLGTFALAISLKSFRTSSYFPTKVRAKVSDFAVLISILVFVSVDLFFDVNTPKLQIPLKFQPTAGHKRGWLVPPLGRNPGWVIVAAAIPAILATILVFMDQQITALIVNRREHKLKKGAGYHLDLLLVAIIIGICSILGLPWVVAATVLSVSHVQSLFVESQCTAPGEKTKFLGVREQRITGATIFMLIGLSVLMTPLLKVIPMPVLFGLFLYMGFSALKGLQFFERIKIIFMPAKHQPDLMYLRRIKITRVHLFTLIQFTCLVVLWGIKSTPAALVFPIMVLMLVLVRKVMEKFFTKHELQVLDDLMPETIKMKKLVASLADGIDGIDGEPCDGSESGQEDEVDGEKKEIQANGPTQVEIPINMTDEMTKSSLWKSFVRDGSVKKRKKSTNNHHSSHSSRSKHRHKHGGKHRSKHSRGSDKDPGLWFSMDRKKYMDSGDNDSVELHQLTAIEEDPVVDPKEYLDVPEVCVTMPSSNGIEDPKDKEA